MAVIRRADAGLDLVEVECPDPSVSEPEELSEAWQLLLPVRVWNKLADILEMMTVFR